MELEELICDVMPDVRVLGMAVVWLFTVSAAFDKNLSFIIIFRCWKGMHAAALVYRSPLSISIYVQWWMKKANMILITWYQTAPCIVMIYRASNETDTYNDMTFNIYSLNYGVLLWNTFEICLHLLFPNLLEESWNQKLTQSMLSKREINKSFS